MKVQDRRFGGRISRIAPPDYAEQSPDRPKIRRRTSARHQAGGRASYFPVSDRVARIPFGPVLLLELGQSGDS